LKRSTNRFARLRSALALLVCGLAGLIYWEIDLASDPSSSEGAPSQHIARDQPAAGVEPFKMLSLQAFSEVVERPLFSSTRRPPPPAASETAATQAVPSRLVGIVLSPSARVALFETGQPANIERVAEGGRFGSWTIERILPDRIIVLNADGRTEIKPELKAANGKTAPTRRTERAPPPPSPVKSLTPKS
jgi:hypothetical protein